MKTKEELELTDEELKTATGGAALNLPTMVDFKTPGEDPSYAPHTYFDTDPQNKKPDFMRTANQELL